MYLALPYLTLHYLTLPADEMKRQLSQVEYIHITTDVNWKPAKIIHPT